jgi:ribosomal protein L22
MAEEKKDTEKQGKPARKPAAKKTSGGSGSGSRARKTTAKPKKETATRGKGAAEADARAGDSATRNVESADSKASSASTSKGPAKKQAERKPAEKKEPAKKAPAKGKSEPRKAPARKPAAKKEAPERPVVNARARYVRVAPRKARLIADQVRGLPLEDALPLLRFSTRSAARDIRKLLESAAANAEANHDLVADDLMIKDIHVDEGPTLRRYRPRALGRATRINKRTSHIAVALTPED